MNLYNENLEFFKEYLYEVYEIITKEDSFYSSDVEIVEDSNLTVSLSGKRCFIHSLYNIQREISEMYSNSDKDVDKLVIFGMGFGYSIEYIHDNFPRLKSVIIIEPDLNVFKQSLKFVDIKHMLTKLKHVTFIINKSQDDAFDILWSAISGRVTEKFDLVYNISYRTLYEGYFETLSLYLKEYIKNTMISLVTDEKFLYSWTTNHIKNLNQCDYNIELFFEKFTDVPAIIVSAGPSLNKTMQYIKDIKDKAVIIAVGSAIKILDTNGIVPHFRFAFDGSEAEKKIFDNIDTKACPLIYGSMLFSEILPTYEGAKIKAVLDQDYIGQYISKEIDESNQLIASGFSVANVALDAVIKMGFKTVIFLGQDLCYTEGEVYAKGSAVENKKIDFTEQQYIKAKDIFGNDVYTIKQYLGMKELLERRIKEESTVKFINATDGGLPIQGTLNINMKKVIAEDLVNKVDISDEINRVFENYIYKEDTLKKIESVVSKILNQITNLIEKNIGINKIMFELDYINTFESEYSKYSFYNDVISKMLNNKFNSIEVTHYYDGDDRKTKTESLLKTMIGKKYELKKYLQLIKELCEEYLVKTTG
jgi:hypothetical protein